ncbi:MULTISPECIES: hypothetical protein, partial [unclassified Kocuria]|uniref:hypothetical protein n=1 Tax=unclassified Kocuria TaxID=2649579 RepID=UPI0013A5C5A7
MSILEGVSSMFSVTETKLMFASRSVAWMMGLPHEQVTVGVSGREAHGGVHDGLVFDGGQSTQTGLSTAAVI